MRLVLDALDVLEGVFDAGSHAPIPKRSFTSAKGVQVTSAYTDQGSRCSTTLSQ